MKKRFLLVAALCAAMNMNISAQDNLALGKTVVASSNSGTTTNVTDGNFNTRWEVNTADEKQVSGVVTEGSYWLYVDLGEATKFNTLRIKWEGGYAKRFKVLVADKLGADGKPEWKDEAILEKEGTLSDFNKYYTYFLDKAVTARYVKLQAMELGREPYFSIWEMGIYNIEDADKVSDITKIETSKNSVAPGEEFNVTVTDQFDQDITNDVEYTCTNAENLGNGKFKASANGKVTITATDKKGNSKTIELVAYAPEMTTAKVSPAIVVTGEETSLTFAVKDQEGKDITDYTTDLTDNKFTATEDGKHEITVKSGDKELKVTVYAISNGTTNPTLSTNDLSLFDESLNGLNEYNNGWEGGYESSDVMDIKGNKVIRVTQAVTYGFSKNVEETGYKSLNFDIYPTEDIEKGYVAFEGADLSNLQIHTLKAGQWNHVSLDVTGATKYSGFIKFKLGTGEHKDATLNILLDNVYLSMGDVEIAENVTVAKEPNARGFYTVSGYAKSAATINAQLTNKDITAYDLTKLKTEGEGYTLTPANPNALIYVSGNGGDNFEPAQNWGDTKNIVGFEGNSAVQWYVPTTSGVNIKDGYAVYQGKEDTDVSFISAKADRPVSYTRSLPAGKYVSTFLPTNAEIPTGCKAYKFKEGTDANTIGFEEATSLEAYTPYVIYNGNNDSVELTFKATGNVFFNFKENEGKEEATLGNAKVKGNFSNFAGNGTQYVLDANSYDEATGTLKLKKCTDKTTIVPFRAYFTLDNPSMASEIKFMLPGEATGINDINANAQTAADIYSIDGRLVKRGATSVKGLASGVYVMNGKKYVVK